MTDKKLSPLTREQTILEEGENLWFEPYEDDPTRQRAIFEDAEGNRTEHVVRIFPAAVIEALRKLREKKVSVT